MRLSERDETVFFSFGVRGGFRFRTGVLRIKNTQASNPEWALKCWVLVTQISLQAYRGASSTRRRTPLEPYRRYLPRVLEGSQRGGRFLMSEVLLYEDTIRLGPEDRKSGGVHLKAQVRGHAFVPPPFLASLHGGVRPFHHRSTCLTPLTLGPYVVQAWSPIRFCRDTLYRGA